MGVYYSIYWDYPNPWTGTLSSFYTIHPVIVGHIIPTLTFNEKNISNVSVSERVSFETRQLSREDALEQRQLPKLQTDQSQRLSLADQQAPERIFAVRGVRGVRVAFLTFLFSWWSNRSVWWKTGWRFHRVSIFISIWAVLGWESQLTNAFLRFKVFHGATSKDVDG